MVYFQGCCLYSRKALFIFKRNINNATLAYFTLVFSFPKDSRVDIVVPHCRIQVVKNVVTNYILHLPYKFVVLLYNIQPRVPLKCSQEGSMYTYYMYISIFFSRLNWKLYSAIYNSNNKIPLFFLTIHIIH